MVCHTVMSTPVISDRETYYYGEGFDRLDENGTILLVCKSIDQDPEFCKKFNIEIPKQSNKVRIDFKYYVFEMKIISRERCQARAIVNTDPHISLVPRSIQNWTAKKFGFYLFKRMRDRAKKFKGSLWEEKQAENQKFYDWLRQKIESYLDKKEKEETQKTD